MLTRFEDVDKERANLVPGLSRDRPPQVDVKSANVWGSCRLIREEEEMESTNRRSASEIYGAHVKQPSDSDRVDRGRSESHGEDVGDIRKKLAGNGEDVDVQ